LNKNAILMITALTRNKNELPLKNVYIHHSEGKTDLQKITFKISEVEDILVGTVFGNYREDSFYLLPMHFLSKECEVHIDWNENRTSFVLATYPTEVNIEYFNEDKDQESQELQLDSEALTEFLRREYSVVF